MLRASHILFGVLVAVVAMASGCPRRTTPQPASATPGTPPPVEDDPPPAEPPPEPVAEPPAEPCAPDGRPWDGKPVDCSYEHEGCCFDSAASACEAAGCPVDRCAILESYPAQISC